MIYPWLPTSGSLVSQAAMLSGAMAAVGQARTDATAALERGVERAKVGQQPTSEDGFWGLDLDHIQISEFQKESWNKSHLSHA